MSYYILSCEGVDPATTILKEPDLPGGPWMDGEALSIDIKEMLNFELDPKRPGKMKAMYETGILLMRNDLVKAIVEGGANNLECFDATIKDLKNDKEFKDYKAVNIVGLVSFSENDTMDEMLNFELADGLIINEKRIPDDLLIFRPANKLNAILVHKEVKEAIEKNKIPNMHFYRPDGFAG